MDNLQQLLQGRAPSQPPEIKLIKDYVQGAFHETVEVMVRERDIVIITHSAALANTLRLRSPEIRELCQTQKKLSFRIA